ncbi:hypothetical protein [Deinococcus sp.]|uniref:hypothetical protein n=1 Tax=Deinococcus sp. TaxID=47478 RepID=UPI003C7B0CA7
MTMQLNLGAFLTRQGITPARLVRATEGRLAPATVYGLASRPMQRIDLQTVGTVLDALSELTGREVHFQDVLEPLTEAGQQRRQEARSRIGAPRRQGHFQGSSEAVPEGDWSVTDQLAELRERDL